MAVKQLIKVLKIKPCGCDAEGKIEVLLLDHAIKLECDYQASYQQVSQAFPENSTCQAKIYLWLDKVALTEKREKSLLPKVVGKYSGRSPEDAECYLVDSIFEIETSNEFGDYQEPAKIGEWVEADGFFFIELPD